MTPILVSNSFPFALIRREVVVRPKSVLELKRRMREAGWVSAWGHSNTLAVAGAFAGADLRPRTERPALKLDERQLPSLDGQSFDEVWLLSPDYAPGFRPQIGEEVPPEKIVNWQVLRLAWTSAGPSEQP